MYITCVNRDVIVECDEFGHAGYDRICEEARQHGLVTANRYRPLRVFRFNPDEVPKAITVNANGQASCEHGSISAMKQFFNWDKENPVTIAGGSMRVARTRVEETATERHVPKLRRSSFCWKMMLSTRIFTQRPDKSAGEMTPKCTEMRAP